MERDEYVDRVRAAYKALDAGRFDAAFDGLDEDVVMHIAGDHPLSGTYRGKEGIRTYVDALEEATEGTSGFTVLSVMVDEAAERVLVEGTAYTGREHPFVRTMVHQLRFDGGRVVEVWQRPFDQAAEDKFWRRQVPPQREP